MANKGNQSGTRRVWTDDELQTLDRLIHQGKPAHIIARRLKRPLWALRNRRDLVERRRGVVYRRGELARLFGVNDKIVVFWQKRGWIPRTRNGAWIAEQADAAQMEFEAFFRALEPTLEGTGHTPSPQNHNHNAQYLITDTAIEAFLLNQDTWVAWEPKQITDPAWRALAETIRAGMDGCWLTSAELETRFGMKATTASRWHNHGDLAGVRVVKYGSALFFWAADIAHWTPPTKRTGHMRAGGHAEQALMMAPLTAPDLAQACDICLASASAILRHLQARGMLVRSIDPAQPRRYIYRRP